MTAKLYTQREAAAVLRVSLSTIKRRVASGDIPTIDVGVPGSPRPRISEDALDQFIKARTNAA